MKAPLSYRKAQSSDGRYVVVYADYSSPEKNRVYTTIDLSKRYPSTHNTSMAMVIAETEPEWSPRKGYTLMGVMTYDEFIKGATMGETPSPKPPNADAKGLYIDLSGKRTLVAWGVVDLVMGPYPMEEAKRIVSAYLKLSPLLNSVNEVLAAIANNATDYYKALEVLCQGHSIGAWSFRRTLHPKQIYGAVFRYELRKGVGLRVGTYSLREVASKRPFLFLGERFDARVLKEKANA